jgi:outer membrane murein-binding lipoprotein Lpp
VPATAPQNRAAKRKNNRKNVALDKMRFHT